jgi:hypothetical protein
MAFAARLPWIVNVGIFRNMTWGFHHNQEKRGLNAESLGKRLLGLHLSRDRGLRTRAWEEV